VPPALWACSHRALWEYWRPGRSSWRTTAATTTPIHGDSLLSVLGSLRPWWLVEGLLVLGELITTPDPKGASRLCRLRSLFQSELLKHAATLPRWLYIDDPLAAVGVFSCCAPSRSSRHLCSRSPVREAAGDYCICCMQNGNGIFHSPSSWSQRSTASVARYAGVISRVKQDSRLVS
jgi:hypothetical protein